MFGQGNGPDDTDRPPSGTRKEEKWASTVFEGPQPNPCRRKKLGAKDSGVDHMFGSDRIDYGNKSNNMVILSAQKKNNNKWKPVRQ